jgi:hypothetical protein
MTRRANRLRVRRMAPVVGGEDRDLAAVPETTMHVQLPNGEPDAAQLVEPVRSLLAALWPLDRDQQRRC